MRSQPGNIFLHSDTWCLRFPVQRVEFVSTLILVVFKIPVQRCELIFRQNFLHSDTWCLRFQRNIWCLIFHSDTWCMSFQCKELNFLTESFYRCLWRSIYSDSSCRQESPVRKFENQKNEIHNIFKNIFTNIYTRFSIRLGNLNLRIRSKS